MTGTSRRLPYPAAVALLAAAYFVAARLGFIAAVAHGVVSSAWPPAGLALAALLLFGVRYWPGIVIGALLANVTSGVSPFGAAGIAAGNTLEAVAGALLLDRVAQFRVSLQRLRDVLGLTLLGAVVSTVVSATIGVGSLFLSGAIQASAMTPLWLVWWSGDAIGILLVAPLLFTWVRGERVDGGGRGLEGAILILILVALTAALFRIPFSYVYAIFPVVSWAALRFGPRGAATTTFLVCGLAVWFTLQGVGPFVGSTPTHNLALLQTFMGLLAVTALVLAALMSERTAAQHAQADAEVQHGVQRRFLEAQLLQSQKMEAIGQLAGGVAHDFNNLLTVILSAADLLHERLSTDGNKRAEVEDIQKAALRAAELTHQLLAFSRQQVLEPRLLDLNEVVANMDKMLRRLIGDDVELRTVPATGLGTVRADPGQLEQVILNLVVNARDAMPLGGRISIKTANVDVAATYVHESTVIPRGEYIGLAVSDTGVGMTSETRARVFEPFFTTKAKWKGTGLGLAMVYGIVKQSGGYIFAESELGEGATFKILLPRVEEPAEGTLPGAASAASLGGSETILVVEDQDEVRALTRRVLESRGYTVLHAPNGRAALEAARTHAGPIHLLVTDVIMPEMSGRDVATLLVQARPQLKVLYISGYTNDSIARHGVLEPGIVLLQKPFTAEAAARKVREVLDTPRAQS
jgi:signal transduction histidine kinase/ActR/RegA family two-component response regulator